jgi:hypothetical protein
MQKNPASLYLVFHNTSYSEAITANPASIPKISGVRRNFISALTQLLANIAAIYDYRDRARKGTSIIWLR